MKVKKLAALLISLTLLTLSLAACGSKDSDSSGSGGETVTLKLGVVGGIYEELWTPAKNALKDQGINVEFVQFSDYVTPNKALNSGEIDLNAFQHRIYLDNEIKTNGYKIEKIGNTFIIPLNLYSNKVTSVKDLKEGDVVAIPNDVTNGGRALKVLEAAGLIKLKASAGFSPTVADIESYTSGIKIKELAANTIPSALADVSAGIINGNFALDFGLKTEKAIFADTSLKEEQYWNLVAARSEDVKNADKAALYKKVVKAFQTAETEKTFKEKFGGYFIAVGWDQDLLAGK
ncbi:MAG: ABC-type metal ion transport system, periplasmic component/surface antigen [Paenibacillaceae bacterium]|jgi:D-methionine transport system substrate-binding protein|nr:ABC-type metal ion transport system, periplasmic component/surface antigen [Paenibacillaceae bacterium]